MFALMSSNKKKLLRNLNSINAAANCGCGNPKLTDVIQPKPKSKTKPSHAFAPDQPISYSSTPSSSWDRNGGGLSDEAGYTSTTFSLTNLDTCSHRPSDDAVSSKTNRHSKSSRSSYEMTISQCPKIGDSVAVVNDSIDPYHDFRQSMLEMILEKEIFSLDDLQELLSCFLELNSPSQHDIIVQAFLDILNDDNNNNDSNNNRKLFFSCNDSTSSPSPSSSTRNGV